MIEVFKWSIPVILAALGETLNQKAGQLNIGLEGMMLGGAYTALVVDSSTHNPYIALAAGCFGALVLAILQNLFTVHMRQDQVVVGTATNLLALGVTSFLFRRQYGQSGQLLSVPMLQPLVFGLDMIELMTVLIVPLLWFQLYRRNWGLLVRGTGEYPDAVRSQGYKVEKIRLRAALVAALLAGAAGAYLCVGITGSFAENMTAGRGFVAIAVVTFGRWSPLGVLLAGLLIGYSESLRFTLQLSKASALPPQFFSALPYLIALGVLLVSGRGRGAPQMLGRPLAEEIR